MGKVRVPGCQRQAYRCNPEVVIRDRPPHLGEFGLDLTIVLGRGLIGKQNYSGCHFKDRARWFVSSSLMLGSSLGKLPRVVIMACCSISFSFAQNLTVSTRVTFTNEQISVPFQCANKPIPKWQNGFVVASGGQSVKDVAISSTGRIAVAGSATAIIPAFHGCTIQFSRSTAPHPVVVSLR
ncbi:MAG: hypothetical protein JJE04_04615 [Acidobacteriia bacterium]|nr:hypothetical protein [Terriglobia bacterium]